MPLFRAGEATPSTRICIPLLCLLLAPVWRATAQPPGGGGRAISAYGARKAQVLLRQQLPCLGCHSLGDSGGRLAPDLATVRERRSPEYIAAMIDDPQGTLPGSLMPRTPMLPATRDVIVHYLQSLPGHVPSGPLPSREGVSVSEPWDGRGLYVRWCAGCHGSTGRGDGPNATHLPVRPAVHADNAMSARSDDALYDTIAGGGAIMDRSARMPAFGATLSDTQIRALVAYIRTLCRCQGPGWSRDGGSVKR